jgi:hypothetical protein
MVYVVAACGTNECFAVFKQWIAIRNSRELKNSGVWEGCSLLATLPATLGKTVTAMQMA